MTLQRLREWLSVVLIALLPFHAFLVTVLTKWTLGPGMPPLSSIALWKEVLMGIILLLAMAEFLGRNEKLKMKNEKWWKIDSIDLIILLLLVLGVLVSILNSQLSIINFVFGFRYDFIPLIAFLVLRRVQWSDMFRRTLPILLRWVGFAVLVYAGVSRFFPMSFFTWLGYSDLHSLYVPGGPLAPFQLIGDSSIQRVQGTFSGPNQLGLWLLIPWSVGLVSLLKSWGTNQQWRDLAYSAFTAWILLLTYSRAAWIGAAVIMGITLWPAVRSMSRRTKILLVTGCSFLVLAAVVFFPSVILRAASSRGHIENPLKAIQTMIDHPLGLGLGTAGPASNRTSDACVMLEEGSDASWAADRPDLCVFIADTQVQPVDRACSCPFLPENWYLQIGVEMGWIGLGLYFALVGAVILQLRKLKIENETLRHRSGQELKMNEQHSSKLSIINYQLSIFLGLSIAALFLHAWEDAAVAYTLWILLASVL